MLWIKLIYYLLSRLVVTGADDVWVPQGNFMLRDDGFEIGQSGMIVEQPPYCSIMAVMREDMFLVRGLSSRALNGP